MTDLTNTIEAKSDQVNADDLMAGPKTIEITKVSANTASAEQPIAINYKGDGGKIYYPCKTVRRLLCAVWGANGAEYVGRSVTLYRDPTVKWGGLEVGGIRISHMSHIDKPVTIALTATRGNKKPVTVKPLEVQRQDTKPAEAPAGISKREFADRLRELIDHGTVQAANDYWAANEAVRAQLPDDKILAMENALADMVENAALAAKIEKENAQ